MENEKEVNDEILKKEELKRDMAIKKKYNISDFFEITIEDKSCILRAPDRALINKVITIASSDPLGAGDMILNSCWLEGDNEILTDMAYNLSACQHALASIEVKVGSIVKK